jgi:hypothetical protein
MRGRLDARGRMRCTGRCLCVSAVQDRTQLVSPWRSLTRGGACDISNPLQGKCHAARDLTSDRPRSNIGGGAST